jgi:hypothetical protein
MAGLVPAIYVFLAEASKKGVDARDKRGHDGGEMIRFYWNARHRSRHLQRISIEWNHA